MLFVATSVHLKANCSFVATSASVHLRANCRDCFCHNWCPLTGGFLLLVYICRLFFVTCDNLKANCSYTSDYIYKVIVATTVHLRANCHYCSCRYITLFTYIKYIALVLVEFQYLVKNQTFNYQKEYL